MKTPMQLYNINVIKILKLEKFWSVRQEVNSRAPNLKRVFGLGYLLYLLRCC